MCKPGNQCASKEIQVTSTERDRRLVGRSISGRALKVQALPFPLAFDQFALAFRHPNWRRIIGNWVALVKASAIFLFTVKLSVKKYIYLIHNGFEDTNIMNCTCTKDLLIVSIS